jgi:small subunit ribosomal protein S5
MAIKSSSKANKANKVSKASSRPAKDGGAVRSDESTSGAPRGDYADQTGDGLQEKLVAVNRTAKVVKGGRIFSFCALVVVGDGKGRIGFGKGKSREVPAAIQKAMERGRRSMHKVELRGNTLQHALVGNFGATKVVLLPAAKGTGLIAGGAVRAVCEVMGIRDVLAKCFGSRTPINVMRATFDAPFNMKSPAQIAEKRGKTLEEIK